MRPLCKLKLYEQLTLLVQCPRGAPPAAFLGESPESLDVTLSSVLSHLGEGCLRAGRGEWVHLGSWIYKGKTLLSASEVGMGWHILEK